MMERKAILESLCHNDERNPDNDLDLYEPEEISRMRVTRCLCDNCFYGRAQLANELLKHIEGKK